MDSWLILGLLGWLMGWVLVCAARAVRFDLASVLLAAGALVAAAAVPWLLRTLRARRRGYAVGDHVIYVAQKVTTRPGARAEAVCPSAGGDSYTYVVRKLWTVVGTRDGRLIEVLTPGGKRRLVAVDDPQLRRAGFLEAMGLRLRWHRGFPPTAGA